MTCIVEGKRRRSYRGTILDREAWIRGGGRCIEGHMLGHVMVLQVLAPLAALRLILARKFDVSSKKMRLAQHERHVEQSNGPRTSCKGCGAISRRIPEDEEKKHEEAFLAQGSSRWAGEWCQEKGSEALGMAPSQREDLRRPLGKCSRKEALSLALPGSSTKLACAATCFRSQAVWTGAMGGDEGKHWKR